MNVAVILAGGTGTRMGHNIPKQFIEVNGKPVLVYSLENFQNHPDIDGIEVVCVDGWKDEVMGYVEQYGITKLLGTVPGGATVQESIRNGVYALEGSCAEEDIVVVHDGVRPLLATEVLSDVIRVCRIHGNGVTSMPYNEQIFTTEDGETTREYIPRERLRRVSTPQAYKFGMLRDAYREAFENEIGIYGSSYTNTMMVELGRTLYFAKGSDRNIKLTTEEDLDMFKTFLAVLGEGGKR